MDEGHMSDAPHEKPPVLGMAVGARSTAALRAERANAVATLWLESLWTRIKDHKFV
jgi:hypothetical protein